MLEADDLALQAADTRELRKHRPNRLGFELAPLSQDDDVVGRGFAPTQPVADFQEGGDRHRNPGERAAQRDLADLDPSTDLDFLGRSQQRDLTDFLQVETDGILTLGRKPSIGFLGNRLRGLFHLILHLDGDLSVLSRIDRGRRGGLEGVRRSFSKCHRVTSLYCHQSLWRSLLVQMRCRCLAFHVRADSCPVPRITALTASRLGLFTTTSRVYRRQGWGGLD